MKKLAWLLLTTPLLAAPLHAADLVQVYRDAQGNDPAFAAARATLDAGREKAPQGLVGEGVAVPHALLPGLKRPVGAFARLDPPQDFDALDGRPADLVFLLLSPADKGADHLKAFARISRFMRRADMRDKLRAARGAEELQALFSSSPRVDAA